MKHVSRILGRKGVALGRLEEKGSSWLLTEARDWGIMSMMRVQREHNQLQNQIARLWNQLTVFEDRYGLTTPEFYERFERGEMGDDADFFEWSATWEMVQDLESDLELLQSETATA